MVAYKSQVYSRLSIYQEMVATPVGHIFSNIKT